MMDPLTLKVEFEGDLRRFRLRLNSDDSAASKIKSILEAINSGYCLGEEPPPLTLKYKDEEGDSCTLVEATVEDFLSEQGAKPLRLSVSRSSVAAAPSPSPVPADPPCKGASTAVAPAGTCEAEAPAAARLCKGGAAGPWKLLICIRTLIDANMMSDKMVASIILQFLPILAQRSHRKQEKLNKLGPENREALLPLLHSVSAHIELVEDALPVKPLLEDFIAGKDGSKLGDAVAALFKALQTSKDRSAVAEAIVAVAPDLLLCLPQLFPDLFDGSLKDYTGPGEHLGTRCSACNAEPIRGPRFHCAEACIDLCGECFIDQGCEASDQQFQCLFEPASSSDAPDTGCTGGNWKEDMKAWKGHGWKAWWLWKQSMNQEMKQAWKEHKAHMKGAFWKGKGKGKAKGKGKWHWWQSDELGTEATTEEGASSVADTYPADGSDAGDSMPPGLELPPHLWGDPWWWKGKGKGKHRDWASGWPWGSRQGSAMHHCPPDFWPGPWSGEGWPSDGPLPQFDNMINIDGIPVGDFTGEQAGNHPN